MLRAAQESKEHVLQPSASVHAPAAVATAAADAAAAAAAAVPAAAAAACTAAAAACTPAAAAAIQIISLLPGQGGFVIEFGGVCYQDTYPDVL